MGVPAESCSKRGIIQHFKRFGRLTNVVCKPRKGFAIVEFETPQVALAAARGGNMMGPSKLKIRRYKARTKPDPSAVASSSATAASGAFPAAGHVGAANVVSLANEGSCHSSNASAGAHTHRTRVGAIRQSAPRLRLRRR